MEAVRLFDYAYEQLENNPLANSIGQKRDGKWEFFSTEKMVSSAEKLAAGLLKKGYTKGDKIAISSYKNRPEWLIVDLATQLIGIINVPLYPTISPKEYVYILNDAEVKACFVGAQDLYDKVKKAQPDVASLKEIFCFDKKEGRAYWEDVFTEQGIDEVHKISKTIKPEELATIIYTSGTTGNPKGVMLAHSNISSIIQSTSQLLPVKKGEKALSFLPFCHIFERAVIFCYLKCNVEVYCTGTDNLGGESGDLQDVKPNFFTTVPRLLEKVYEKIYNKGLELTGAKKKLFFWALDLTKDHDYDVTYSGMNGLKRKIADKLIFSKWRAALGGNLNAIVTGAAPMPAKIARVFTAAGIPILEGYGLTETSPTLTVNSLGTNSAMIGTVGPTLDIVDIQIEEDAENYGPGEGEILAHGPNVMIGYYNKPDKTNEVFTEINGKRYFRTGDIGKFVHKGGREFLKITDRKKELLKTSGGKYVAPAPIESRLKEDGMIEQAMVVGDGKKFVSALIIPSEDALKSACADCGITWTSKPEMLENHEVQALFQKCIDKLNPGFSKVEQIKKFTLLDSAWEPIKSDGTASELTPTLKLKRRVILDKCHSQIEQMYAD